jgi:hypothetical protein
MDRRGFLLTSLAGAAHAHVLDAAAVEPAEPKPSEPDTNADTMLGLANELQMIHQIVEGYSQLMLRKLDEADALRRAPMALLATAERLRELTGELRAMAQQAGM